MANANSTTLTCSVETCETVPVARGWCDKHYRRWIKFKDPIVLPDGSRICAVPECGKPHDARGLCSMHYHRMKRHGLIEYPYRVEDPCAKEGCSSLALTRFLCSAHYQGEARAGRLDEWPEMRERDQRIGSARTPRKDKLGNPLPCKFPECGRDISAKGLCSAHYGQLRAGKELRPIGEIKYCRTPGCGRDIHIRRTICRRCWEKTNKYGITEDQLVALFKHGKCFNPGCGSTEGLHIDHDHSCCPKGVRKGCGKCVRGLLCRKCNLTLGWIQDDIGKLYGLVSYLKDGVI